MKRIGIDARLYYQTGVGVYLRNLIHYLQQMNPPDIEFFIYVLRENTKSIILENPHFKKREVTSRWHSISEQVEFKSVLEQDALDLMHFTYFSYPMLYKGKFIATVHDLTPLVLKTGKASTKNPLIYYIKYLFFKKILSSQIKKSLHVITPTETIKKQLIKKYGDEIATRITPLYEGVDYQLKEATENSDLKKKFNKPFFIYIGNFYPHKNVEALLKAFVSVNNATLILLGPEDYFASRIRQIIKNLSLEDKVLLISRASQSDLVFFYKHALALIHPSLSEGFGLPIVESAYFNLPIIASDIEVFNEVLGDNYIKFEPRDFSDIAKKINDFLKEKKVIDYKEMMQKYSFKKMTQETLRLYLKYV